MKKINFTNANVTAPASVEIDGISHDVTPAVIEGGVLASADNLNQLQSNIEEAILNPVVESIKSKNLFNKYGSLSDYIEWSSGNNTLENDGKIKATSNIANGNGKGQIIQLKPNTTYTFSAKIDSVEVDGYTTFRILDINEDDYATNILSEAAPATPGQTYNYQFTTGSIGKIWLTLNGINNYSDYSIFKYVIYDNIQIEEGSFVTNYNEYKKFDTNIYSFDTNLVYDSSVPQKFQNDILKNAKLVICNFYNVDGFWNIQTQHLDSGISFNSLQTSTNWYVASNFDSDTGTISFITKSDTTNFILNKIVVVK